MNKHSFIDDLMNLYDQPEIRSLIQLIPAGIGSALDVALISKIQEIRKDRLKSFFDELGAGKIKLTKNLIESEDFLHCYFSTIKAAINTRRREKIKMFARLLKSSTLPNLIANTDEYEEHLKILDDLSFKELRILILLDKYESRYPKNEGENDWQRADRFWKNFIDELMKKFGISKEENHAVLIRISRSGCYEEIFGFGHSGGKGKLSPTYFQLKKLIINENCNYV